MRLAALISGGKDSLYAAYLAKKDGHELVSLITFVSENPDSYMFHTPNIHLTELIAEAMSLPLIKVRTKGEKEKEVEDIKAVLQSLGAKIDGVVCGAIASTYQMKRIENVAADLGLACVAPLWRRGQEEVLKEEVAAGFEMIFSHVAAEGLDASWLGKKIDSSSLDSLLSVQKRFRISPVGEGGEFETLVLDCPLYKKRLVIEEAEKVWDAKTRSGTYVVKKAGLENKKA
jgi:ABC transporter with metal-binding/Fe-S-binding domain ATP-binding protein